MIKISILERPTADTLLVSWRESGRCNYTEQLWRLKKAPGPRICAKSGAQIKTGERVFAPAGRLANSRNFIRPDAVELGVRK